MSRIVVLHGAGGDSTSYAGFGRSARARGYEVETPDLPGHGAHPGPLGAGAVDEVRARIGSAVVRATSLGALLALHGAERAAAVVALAPASERLAAERFPGWDARVDAPGFAALLASLDTEAAVARLGCPVLYVVAADDDRVPRAWVERLQAATPRSELVLLPGGGHGGPSLDPAVDALTLDWIAGAVPP